MKPTNTFHWFRKIAFTEGISFLVLLLIAMPLKYVAGYPLAVTIAGGIHGILFIAFLIWAWWVKSEYRKNFAWLGKAILASVLPFGTLVMDKQWKKEEGAAAEKTAL
jgi:integral membrane protein